MTGAVPHRVVVTTLDADRALLLSLASVLHRRGVDVLAADLKPPEHGRRQFCAVVVATTAQARTLRQTLSNRIDVVSVDLDVADHDELPPAQLLALQPAVPASS
ncbi:hypothetical protein [Nocardioides humi]|uniref:ACT domain-containing protein n=1 Tax=Nocardioides humi TaxID=449461 RepID=A0ABN2ATB1_9ACTN|nr:hypothetical protein [Nocardioides humi]